jgi:hypothetical protein
MGVVVDFIEDTGNAVGDVFEFVGDVVEDAAEIVGDTIEYVVENPEIALIIIAAPYATAAVGSAIGASTAAVTLATPAVTAAAITASQGGDLEDIGKSALAAFISAPIGQYVGTQVAAATGAQSTLQVGLSNAVGGAAGGATSALVLGEDVGKSAALSAAGSFGASLARSGAAQAGVNKYGAAGDVIADVGEAAGRTAAGGDIRQELISAGISSLAREGRVALEELRAPTTAYFPRIGPDMAALPGSTIEGQPVTDVATGQGVEGQPKLFPKGLMVYDPQTNVSEIYAVRNQQGEVFEARNIFFADGTVQRIIYDPNTDNYQQQILKQGKPGESVDLTATMPAVDVKAGPDDLSFEADTIRRELARRERVKTTGESAIGGTQGAAESELPTGGVRTPTGGDEGEGGAGVGRESSNVDTPTGTQSLPKVEVTGGISDDVRVGNRLGVGDGGGEGEGEGDGALIEEPTPLDELSDAELIKELERLVSEEGALPEALLDVRSAIVRRPRARGSITVSPRATGQGAAAIVGDKEPIFGGEPDQQQEVWNERSLRLRKALGL